MSGNREYANLRRFSWLPKFLFLLAALLVLFPTLAHSGPKPHSQGADVVLRVVDGDTLSINYNGHKENVRLIGIDTPESKPNKKARKDAGRSNEDIRTIVSLGKESAQFVKSLVHPGDPIFIEFDRQTRDKYGRLLGYVYLADGTMLNEEIVRAGYANLMTYPPNVKYRERFLRAYQEAREYNRGLWSRY